MVTSRKSQTELEQPAKVYQLDAVDKKVDDAIGLLNEILAQTKGVATHADLATVKEDVIKEMKEWTKDEIKKVHLEYSPTKKAAWWFAAVIISMMLAQFLALYIMWTTGGK